MIDYLPTLQDLRLRGSEKCQSSHGFPLNEFTVVGSILHGSIYNIILWDKVPWKPANVLKTTIEREKKRKTKPDNKRKD